MVTMTAHPVSDPKSFFCPSSGPIPKGKKETIEHWEILLRRGLTRADGLVSLFAPKTKANISRTSRKLCQQGLRPFRSCSPLLGGWNELRGGIHCEAQGDFLTVMGVVGSYYCVFVAVPVKEIGHSRADRRQHHPFPTGDIVPALPQVSTTV